MRGFRWLPVVATTAMVGCLTAMRGCDTAIPCAHAAAAPQVWVLGVAAGLGVLAATALMTWLGRTIWLATSTSSAVRNLPRVPLPGRLRGAARRTEVGRLSCAAVDRPLAFCAGTFRPTIVVTSGLMDLLDAAALDAVLLHEEQHRRRAEPLRRVAMQAAAEVLFFLPVIHWMREQRLERSELAADRVVIDRVGPVPLASALWALGFTPLAGSAVGFDGAPDARVCQLLGDPLPRSRPGLWPCANSVIGVVMVTSLAACIGLSLVS